MINAGTFALAAFVLALVALFVAAIALGLAGVVFMRQRARRREFGSAAYPALPDAQPPQRVERQHKTGCFTRSGTDLFAASTAPTETYSASESTPLAGELEPLEPTPVDERTREPIRNYP